MPLDGFPHASPLLVHPIAYAADAPFGPDALSGALTSAYYASRRNAVRLVEQCYGRSSLSAADEATGRWVYSLSSPVIVGGGRAYVHELTGRASAVVLYQCVTRANTRVRLQLRVRYVSGTLGNGQTVIQDIGPSGGTAGSDTGTSSFSLEELAGGWYAGECSVGLVSSELNTVARFQVWAYAENGSEAIAFRPWRVSVFGDVL